MTRFALSEKNGFTTTGDSSTSAATTSVTDAPWLGGTTSSSINDNQTAQPFSGLVLSDVDPNQTYSISVTLSAAANGGLSYLAGGHYDGASGVYTLSGVTLSAAQAALRGLVF